MLTSGFLPDISTLDLFNPSHVKKQVAARLTPTYARISRNGFSFYSEAIQVGNQPSVQCASSFDLADEYGVPLARVMEYFFEHHPRSRLAASLPLDIIGKFKLGKKRVAATGEEFRPLIGEPKALIIAFENFEFADIEKRMSEINEKIAGFHLFVGDIVVE